MARKRTSFLLCAIATVTLGAIVAIALLNWEEVRPAGESVALGLEAKAMSAAIAGDAVDLAALPQEREVAREEPLLEVVPSAIPDAGNFDFFDLAPLRARVMGEVSGDPLYKTLCVVEDRKGVQVEVMTDADGYLRSDELLLKGPIALRYLHPTGEVDFAQGNSHFNTVDALLMHSGSQGAEDVWKARCPRYVSLAFDGVGPLEGGIYVTLLSSIHRRVHVDVWNKSMRLGRPEGGFGFDQFDRIVFTTHQEKLDQRYGHWSISKIGEHVPGRALRAVTIKDGVVYAAETKVPVVPHWQDESVKLHFLPMLETDPDALRKLYSETTTDYLVAHFRRERRLEAQLEVGVGSITGRVTSESGAFRGKTRVLALPSTVRNADGTLLPRGEAQVDWSKGMDSSWVGEFEIGNLALGSYQIEVRPEPGAYMIPSHFDVTVPYEFDKGTLIVKDDIKAASVQLSLPGLEATGYDATLRYEFADRSWESRLVVARDGDSPFIDTAPNAPYEFPVKVPKGVDFTVTVTTRGGGAKVFTTSDFTLARGVWLGTLELE